jgi:sugar transferase (PEP-CTERM system associated)
MLRIFSHYVSARLMLLVFVEALVLLISVRVGHSFHAHGTIAGIDPTALPTAATFAVGTLLVINGMGLYQLDLSRNDWSVFARLVVAVLLGLGLALLIMYWVPSLYLGLDGLAFAAVAAVMGTALVRFGFYKLDNSGAFKARVLVLGTGSRVMKLAEIAQRNKNHMMVGYVALSPSGQHYVPLPRVLSLAPGESLPSVVQKYGIDEIVLAVRDRRGGGFPVQELLECRLKGVKVTELSTFFEREYQQVILESLNPSWMVLGDGFRQGVFRTVVKRFFDLAASTALLLVALPVIVLAAMCILLESGLPVLYRQERIGQNGRIFTIYKLRSMKNGAESDGTPRWADSNDDRNTRVGRILRKLRIDELPQIINVFKGEMSFVGPRPERPFFVDQLVQQIPYYALRHSIKPGITGWAQVQYHYGASLDDAVEKLQYDLYYVKNHTLFLDLMVLIATMRVVLWDRGAR